jgi:membrane dipeptidase
MKFSRREILQAAGAGSLAAVLPSALHAATRKELSSDMLIIDALGGVVVSDEGRDNWKKSGISMLETTLGARGKPTFSYDAAVRDIAAWHGTFTRSPDWLIHVKSTDDIMEARRTGKLGVMIGFQNGTHLDRNPDNVEFFYNLGIRQIQLTYNTINALGAGCAARHDVGLTHFGVQVVNKMNELGMIIDLSHTGKRTGLDTIELSDKPVLFTHSNCEALCDNPRCKSDEEIKALAARGGVMGMTTVNFFVSKKPRSTAEDFFAHIDHAVDLVGVDHVGIGSDSLISGWRFALPTEDDFWAAHADFLDVDFQPEVDVRWPPFIEELDVPERMWLIAEGLDKRGYSQSDIAKIMGQNFMRAYKAIMG